MSLPKGSAILKAVYSLIGYDKNRNELGNMHGGTSNRDLNEKWTKYNAIAFVGDKEVPLLEITFKKEDVDRKIADLESRILHKKEKLVNHHYIGVIHTFANNICALYEERTLLMEYTKDKLVE